MEIIEIVKSLGVGSKRNTHNDDLFVDRLNHKYTAYILLTFTAIVTGSHYFTDPINCW